MVASSSGSGRIFTAFTFSMRDPEFQEFDRDYHGASAYAHLSSKPDLWQRMSRVMEVLLYILILAAIMRLFWPEVEKQRKLNAELAEVEQVKSEREARVAELRQEYGLLKSDREYFETIARDRLDKALPGEYIIRIERPEEEGAEKDSATDEIDRSSLPKVVKPLPPQP